MVAGLAAGCMVVPRTSTRYNPDCQVVERHVTLEAQQVGALGGCRNNGQCATLLAIYGVVAAGSVVISGSVAVVGNVAYWFEEKAQCARTIWSGPATDAVAPPQTIIPTAATPAAAPAAPSPAPASASASAPALPSQHVPQPR